MSSEELGCKCPVGQNNVAGAAAAPLVFTLFPHPLAALSQEQGSSEQEHRAVAPEEPGC